VDWKGLISNIKVGFSMRLFDIRGRVGDLSYPGDRCTRILLQFLNRWLPKEEQSEVTYTSQSSHSRLMLRMEARHFSRRGG
jgi:hypothetical protein